MLTRRLIVGAPIALIVARSCAVPQPAPPLTGASAPGLRKRVAVTSPEARPHLKALATAIRKMKDPRTPKLLNWENQREIHAGHWRHHWTWRFLPWHRAQLQCFEDIVRHHSGFADYAQPYWDPNDHRTIPDLFFDRSSPFFREGRSEDLRGLDFPREFDRLVRTGNWAYTGIGEFDFRGIAGREDEPGAVDSGIHGLVHVMIGGDMGAPDTAPLDPLFFFHHCNIDRMWATWQKETGSFSTGKYPSAFNDESFDGIFALPSGEEYKGKAADYIDHRTVHSYDRDYAAPIITEPQGEPRPVETAPPPSPPPPPEAPVLKLVSEATRSFSSRAAAPASAGAPAVLAVPIAAAFRPTDTPKRRVEIARAIAAVRIAGPAATEGALRVYLSEAGYAGPVQPDNQRFAQIVALFGAFHHAGDARFSLDLTRLFRAAFANGATDSVEVIVEFLPIGDAAPKSITVAQVDLAVTARTFAAQ